jgi:isopropylmalate/homocitrate/citramalate synthase
VPVGVHLHDTRGTGLANALAAVEAGVSSLDASAGGVGGCPFAPGATGNIATDDLVYLLHGQGLSTGIDLDALIGVSHWLADQLGHDIPGRVQRAGDFTAVSGRTPATVN